MSLQMNEKGNDVFCVLCCPYSLNLVHDYQHLQSVTCPPLCSTNSIELCAPYLPHDDNVSGPVNSFMHVEFTSMEICSPISVFQGGLLYPEQSVRFMVYIPARTDKCRMTCRKLCYMPFGNVRVSGWLPFSCSDRSCPNTQSFPPLHPVFPSSTRRLAISFCCKHLDALL